MSAAGLDTKTVSSSSGSGSGSGSGSASATASTATATAASTTGSVAGLDSDVLEIRDLPSRMITLTAKIDGKSFVVDQKHAQISTLIFRALQAEQQDAAKNPESKAKDEPTVLVLEHVKSSDALESVIRYMNEHKGVEPPIMEKPLRSKVMADVCPHKWDATFIDEVADVKMKNLYDLVTTSNYLDIQSLLHLGCAKVAAMIKGQPLEKVKEILDPERSPAAERKASGAKEVKDAKEMKDQKTKDTDEKDPKAAKLNSTATAATASASASASATAAAAMITGGGSAGSIGSV